MSLAFVALGGNIPGPAGSPEATLAAAAVRLADLGRITARSSLYSTTPVGADIAQPRFLNAVLALETTLTPFELLGAVLLIEREFGRDRVANIPNGPRTLDLDILFYGDLVLSESSLKIPHPRIAERAFVLVPLHEIAPDLRDPRSGKTVSLLLAELSSGHASLASSVVPVASALWTGEKG
jgi:2-amino-4-hydroxy-6-hydroxymethyldihydropteridine diphosphokinase